MVAILTAQRQTKNKFRKSAKVIAGVAAAVVIGFAAKEMVKRVGAAIEQLERDPCAFVPQCGNTYPPSQMPQFN